MSRILVQNATILTLDDEDTFYYPGEIEIRDDKIFRISSSSEGLQEEYAGKTIVIDGTDKLVMPGLVDLHFHTSVAKGYGDDLPLWEFLDRVWYPSIRALSPEDCKTAALHSYSL